MCLSIRTARQFCIITAFFLLPAGELAAAPVQTVTARELVRTVDSALAGVAQAALDPGGGLNRAQPGFAPFWDALAAMRQRVIQIESALARRDAELFVLLDQGSADLGALRVAWARAGAGNAAIAEGVRVASASYRALRTGYGREALRHRQGGELSDAERLHFQRIQRLQRRFAENLQILLERSRQRGDEAAVAELDRFRREAARIASAPLVLEGYLNALIASGETRGEWEADAPYLRQDASPELAAADEMVQDLYVESDIGQVFTVDLGDGGWSSLERETEVPTGVQFYEAAGETKPPSEEIAETVSETDLPEDEAVEGDRILEEEDLGEPEAAAPEADPEAAAVAPQSPAEVPPNSEPVKPVPASPPGAPAVSPPIG
jgi:hypothetical protein